MVYTVGEMAKLLGVTASTLRYYDKEGLLPFVDFVRRERRMDSGHDRPKQMIIRVSKILAQFISLFLLYRRRV